MDAYQRALDTLPKDDLTPAEIKQKSQYEDGLKKAQELLNAPRRPIESNPLALKMHATLKITPWDTANDIVPELAAQNLSDSSAWSIHSAYSEFKEGVAIMKNTRRVQRNGKMMVLGDTGRFQQSPPNEILEELYEEAELLLIKSVDNDTINFSHSPAVMWSFFRNCSGNANMDSIHSALARIESDDEKQHFQSASEFYVKAADATDDEKHGWYLHCALMYMEAIRAPTPGIFSCMLESLPKMQRICRSKSRTRITLCKDLELEAELLQKI
ncbi:hypothetical protein DFS33DRAFT_1382943 [Desarmillaria ectypa]|nr:hypothetical protein DFS33DRAFT_1382943 [Desarmillaria ectypa]